MAHHRVVDRLGQPHSRGAPLGHHLAVPVHAKPFAHGGCDRRANAVDCGQGLLVRLLDGIQAAELPGQRLRRGGPDVPDRQRHQHSPQRSIFRGIQVGQQLASVGRKLSCLGAE